MPLGKAAYHLPHTISSALHSNSPEPESIAISSMGRTNSTALQSAGVGGQRKRSNYTREPPQAALVRLSRSIVRKGSPRRTRFGSGTQPLAPPQPERETRLDKSVGSSVDENSNSQAVVQSIEDSV